jgi:sugar phosphate isomerase/epimerase
MAMWQTRARAQETPIHLTDAPPPPVFKISLAEWSYHDALQKGRMVHSDFAKVAKETHGIGAVEYVNTFFKDKVRDPEYVKDLKKRASDLDVKILLIMCDAEGDLGHADKAKRADAVLNHKRWLEAAHELGCHSIRVNAYGSGTPEEHMAQVADGLHELCVLADPLGLNVIVENHGGISSNGAWLAGVMKKTDHPRVGTLPDFGNFTMGDGKNYDRYQGVAEMMPFAKAVSAKSYDFDAKGEETTIDYARMLTIVLAAGYHGHLGIEYEGTRLSEKDGVDATKRLLERIRGDVR